VLRTLERDGFRKGKIIMSVRIRISYTEDEELAGVLQLLSPALKFYKVRPGEGRYKKAYAELDIWRSQSERSQTKR